eukprot:4166238-Pyramimonas_sp.AAC.2
MVVVGCWALGVGRWVLGVGCWALQTDMGAGHFSASDRYKHLKERAFELAFVLDQLGLADKNMPAAGLIALAGATVVRQTGASAYAWCADAALHRRILDSPPQKAQKSRQ